MNLFVFLWSVVIFSLESRMAQSASGPSHNKLVVCYLGTWSVYRPDRGSFTIEHLDPSLCTHIIYSFVGLDILEDSPKPLDPWQDLTEDYGKGGFQRITNLRTAYPHVKVTVAIGGWNEGSTNYSRLVSDEKRRRRFVKNALLFVKKYNFDGLDLDWEFPGKRGGNPSDKENFLLLVKELRAEFKKHNLLLTAAFGAGKDTIDVAYDVEGLSAYLDFIHMMCYDYHGAWDQKTGANAPLKADDVLSVEYSINYMLQLGAPPNKLVLGLPLYGRTFLLEKSVVTNPKKKMKLGMPASNIGFQGPFTRENGFMGYNEICLELNNKTAGWTTYWDSKSHTPYAVNENKVLTYDNQRSLREKIQFAMQKKLAGVMVWSIDTDDFQGDCAKSGENDRYSNFPLMRSINKSVVETLEEFEEEEGDKNEKDESRPDDRENEIDSDKHTKDSSSVVNVSFGCVIICIFRFLFT
ncbi:probable chitinase 2 [Coccinella septempunctata]|uniref:probable chitinase 2 n=1 Tax=Coccinella septempunctata TaxID=41139 RepID=UPI001D088518|nr:probable chitinase 2 [Coccinella septempunctata]